MSTSRTPRPTSLSRGERRRFRQIRRAVPGARRNARRREGRGEIVAQRGHRISQTTRRRSRCLDSEEYQASRRNCATPRALDRPRDHRRLRRAAAGLTAESGKTWPRCGSSSAGAAGRMGRMLVRAIHETIRSLRSPARSSARIRPGSARTPACSPAARRAASRSSPIRSRCCSTPTRSSTFPRPPPASSSPALAAQARIVDVIGTTGLADDDLDRIDAAARHAPIVRSGNMSLGVNLLAALTRARRGRARRRFRHRNRRDASPHEGRRAVGHGADARRSGRRGARRFAEEPFGAGARRHDRRAAHGRHRLCVAARRHRRRRSQRRSSPAKASGSSSPIMPRTARSSPAAR